jgi:hypothetical protein
METSEKQAQELEQSIQFQLDNVIGWIGAKQYDSALIKAEYLIKDLRAIVELKAKGTE